MLKILKEILPDYFFRKKFNLLNIVSTTVNLGWNSLSLLSNGGLNNSYCHIAARFSLFSKSYFWYGNFTHVLNLAVVIMRIQVNLFIAPTQYLLLATYLLSAIVWTNLLLQVTEDSLVCQFASENLGKTMFICDYFVTVLCHFHIFKVLVGTVPYGGTSKSN